MGKGRKKIIVKKSKCAKMAVIMWITSRKRCKSWELSTFFVQIEGVIHNLGTFDGTYPQNASWIVIHDIAWCVATKVVEMGCGFGKLLLRCERLM